MEKAKSNPNKAIFFEPMETNENEQMVKCLEKKHPNYIRTPKTTKKMTLTEKKKRKMLHESIVKELIDNSTRRQFRRDINKIAYDVLSKGFSSLEESQNNDYIINYEKRCIEYLRREDMLPLKGEQYNKFNNPSLEFEFERDLGFGVIIKKGEYSPRKREKKPKIKVDPNIIITRQSKRRKNAMEIEEIKSKEINNPEKELSEDSEYYSDSQYFKKQDETKHKGSNESFPNKDAPQNKNHLMEIQDEISTLAETPAKQKLINSMKKKFDSNEIDDLIVISSSQEDEDYDIPDKNNYKKLKISDELFMFSPKKSYQTYSYIKKRFLTEEEELMNNHSKKFHADEQKGIEEEFLEKNKNNRNYLFFKNVLNIPFIKNEESTNQNGKQSKGKALPMSSDHKPSLGPPPKKPARSVLKRGSNVFKKRRFYAEQK